MRTVLSDVDRVMASVAYRAWAVLHRTDAQKVTLERAGNRRPIAGDPYARCLIEAIRVGLEWETGPPDPVPLSLAELGRNVMFTAQDPEVALRLAGKAGWKVAFTADPGREGKWDAAVRAAAPKFRQAGIPILVWGVQTQIGAARIRQLAADLRADGPPIFQAETVEEYDTAMAAGAKLIVGNPNSWTQAQRDDAMYRGTTLGTLFEVYANAGSPFPDVASSQGVPITSEVLGVGSWESGPDVQLRDYLPHTPAGVWATMSVYAAEYMNEDSWGLLP